MRNEISDATHNPKLDNQTVATGVHQEVFQSWAANGNGKQDVDNKGGNEKEAKHFVFNDIYADCLNQPHESRKLTPAQRAWRPDANSDSDSAREWHAEATKQRSREFKTDDNHDYTVQKGDSLYGIAERHLRAGGDKHPSAKSVQDEMQRIIGINPELQDNRHLLHPGMKIHMEAPEAVCKGGSIDELLKPGQTNKPEATGKADEKATAIPGESGKGGLEEVTPTKTQPSTVDDGINSQNPSDVTNVPGDVNKLLPGIMSKMPRADYRYYGDPGMLVTPSKIGDGIHDEITVLPDNFANRAPALGDRITVLPEQTENKGGFTTINADDLQRLNAGLAAMT